MPKIEYMGMVDASTVDCCGKGVCAVVYLCGCPFRCPWCHNAEIATGSKQCMSSDANEIVSSLKENFLVQSVTLTGGEPLEQEYLLALIDRIKKETGLAVKLDTNGFYSKRLAYALPRIDSLSMDIKASLNEKYGISVGRADWENVVEKINESLILLSKWDNPKEARTTIVPGITDTIEDIEKITLAVKKGGFQRYILQQFRPDKTLDPEYRKLKSPALALMQELGAAAKKELPDCRVYVVSAQKGMEEIRKK
ncbi:MAG: radical SAM protein [Candidatus Altiarchaeia archaeon]